MKTKRRIGLIGDYNPQVRAHKAIRIALDLAGQKTGCEFEATWLHTASLTEPVAQHLSAFDGLWCVPNSPYANMRGALEGIRHAREQQVPFLGTCGGFQHAVIEYVRNVRGVTEADHAESNPAATTPLISRLSCSLVGVSGTIQLEPGTCVARLYGREQVTEQYHCNFGLNRELSDLLDGGQLRVSGRDKAGEVRIVELLEHRFFVGTLFQPELAALRGEKHPLVEGFLQAISS